VWKLVLGAVVFGGVELTFLSANLVKVVEGGWLPLLVATLVVVSIAVALPFSPLADTLGFTRLPADFLAAVAGMAVAYLFLIELGKHRFYRIPADGPPLARPRPPRQRRIHHRASRWSIRGRPLRPAGHHRRRHPGAGTLAA
jgi:hypothetical protein